MSGCQWFVHFSRGREPSEFCGADTLPGSSYCRQHHPRVWKKPERCYSGGPLAEVDGDSDVDDTDDDAEDLDE